ncbi:MAG TPA: PAS domain S-box protein [Bacteroidales bacterium]|nr:PAS domain S-box protein [Bacteroidales bacterium]HPS17854.1 PAS domain S-box protein [Bacteroidales bacterium]
MLNPIKNNSNNKLSVKNKTNQKKISNSINKTHGNISVKNNSNEFNFNALAEISPSAIFIYSKNKVEYVNDVAAEITGYSKEELLQMKFWEIAHPKVQEKLKKRGHDRLSGKKILSTYEIPILTKNGKTRYIEFTAKVTEYKGEPTAIGVAIDITENKLALEEINFKNSQRIQFQNSLVKLLKNDEYDLNKFFKILTKTVSNTLNVERTSIWRFTSDRKFLSCDLLYIKSKNEYSIENMLEVEKFPKYFNALFNDLSITADDVLKNKSTSEFNEIYLRPLNIISMIDIPIQIKGKVIGVICCEHTKTKRHWTEEEQDYVTSVAEIVSINIEANERNKTEKSLSIAYDKINSAYKKLKEREEYIGIEKEKLEITLRSIGDGVITTDCKGNIIVLNKTAEILTGWTQAEASGKPLDTVFVLIDDTTKKKCDSPAEKIFTTGEYKEQSNNTTSLLSKNGTKRIISNSAAPICDSKNKLIGTIIVFRDITEQKRSELELKENEEGYRTLFEAANDANMILQDGVFVACNEKGFKMYKCGPEKLIGKTPYDFSPQFQPNGIDSKTASQEKINLALQGIPQFFEWTHRRADGVDFYAEVTLNKIIVQNNVFLQAIVRDIDYRKKMEKELQKNEEIYRLISKAASDYVFSSLIDENDNLTLEWVAGAFETITGYNLEEYSAKGGWRAFIHPDDIKVDQMDFHNLKLSKPVATEIRTITKNKSIKWVRVYAHPVIDPESKKLTRIYGAVQDITKRKKAEEDLTKSETKYRTLIDSTDTGFVIIDQQGKVLDANQKYVHLAGFENISEILNHNVLEWTSDESKTQNAEAIRLCKTQGFIRNLEIEYVHKNGNKVSLLISATIAKTDSETVMMSLVSDITHRKQIEDALRKSENHLHNILEMSNLSMAIIGFDRKVEYINRHAVKTFGYNPKDITDMDSWFRLAYPDEKYRAEVIDQWTGLVNKAMKENCEIERREYLTTCFDGSVKTMVIFGVIVDDKIFVMFDDITESKKAEAKLKESEAKFRKIYESGPLGMAIVNNNFNFTSANNTFCQMLGYTEQELKHLTFKDITHPENLSEDIKNIRKLFSGEIPFYKTEKQYICKDKKNIWASVTVTANFDNNDNFVYFVVMIENITERKQQEEVKRLNEARLEALLKLNNLTDKPEDDLIDFALNEAVKLTGSKFGFIGFMSDDDEIITLHAWSSEVMNQCKVKDTFKQFATKDIGILGAPIRNKQSIISNNYSSEDPSIHNLPEGHIPIIRYMNIPIFDGDKIVIVAATANKETDYNETDANQLTLLMKGMWQLIQRRKTDRALKESEEQYRIITTNVNDIIVKFGTNGKLLYISPSYEKTLGYDIENMIGHSVFEFFHPDEITFLREYTSNLLQKKAPNILRHRLRKIDGSYIWCETNNQTIVNENGTIKEFVAVIRNITTLLNSERLLKEKEAAELANKSKSEFLANMSHEIRNPLNSIIGLSNSLGRMNLDQEQGNIVEALKISSNNLLNIINDVLDFSKIEANKAEILKCNFNIKEIINSIYLSNKTTAEFKNLSYSYHIDENVPENLYGDSIKLKQILINLTGNAIKFTEKGSVSINVKEIKRKISQSTIRFEITDTGIGIKEDDRDKVFESFTQLDSSTTKLFGGTGLGLAIVKRYTELLKGKIDFESQINKGSTFFVEIPFIIAEKQNAETEIKPSMGNDKKHKIKILLVEDDGINQLYMKSFLNKMGYKVDTAFNGIQALEKYDNSEYDIILMDGQMPKMDGFEATQIIREKELKSKKHTKIIAITGYAVTGDKEKFINAGMDDYIAKPIDENKLLELIKQYTDDLNK